MNTARRGIFILRARQLIVRRLANSNRYSLKNGLLTSGKYMLFGQRTLAAAVFQIRWQGWCVSFNLNALLVYLSKVSRGNATVRNFFQIDEKNPDLYGRLR